MNAEPPVSFNPGWTKSALKRHIALYLVLALSALYARLVRDVHRGAPVLLVRHAAVMPPSLALMANLLLLMLLLLLLLLLLNLLLLRLFLLVAVHIPESAVDAAAAIDEAVEPFGNPARH